MQIKKSKKLTLLYAFFAFNLNPLLENNNNLKYENLILSSQKFLQTQKLSQNSNIDFLPHQLVESIENFTTLKYKQIYKGIEIFGEEIHHHFLNQEITQTDGEILNLNLDTNPKINLQTLNQILEDRFQTKIEYHEDPRLIVFNAFDATPRLSYLLSTKRSENHIGYKMIVDAVDGKILYQAPSISHFTRIIYSADTPQAKAYVSSDGFPTKIDLNLYKLIFNNHVPRTQEERNKTDQSALRAFFNSGIIYLYYKKKFGRLSYDNKDSPLVSVVHIGDKMANAFWDSYNKIMAYGDGDGEFFIDLTYGLDVAGHELTHAVTEHTAGLLYQGESGAINESMSDFFGKMITYRGKSDNWNIGEAVMAPKARTQGVFAIRNMKNPSMYEQPRSLGDPKKVPTDGNCNDFNDNCGVHINSGIANIVAANITRLIGQEKAERLYYTVLTQYLKPTSGFHHLRQSIEAACLLFYASEPKTCYYVQWTFEKAEIERQKLLNQFYKRIRKK